MNTLYLVMDRNAADIGYDTRNVFTVTGLQTVRLLCPLHGQHRGLADARQLRVRERLSRLSVIFLSEENIDVKPMIASWIAQEPPECQGPILAT